MRNRWLILCVSPLLLVSLLLSSCTCNCTSNEGVGGDWNPQDLETQGGLPTTIETAFELPFTYEGSLGSISMSWDHTGEKFLIVGGQDLFGNTPVHTRFIMSGDTSDIEIIEYIDDPEADGYQRYECVAYHTTEGYALISGINGGLWKISQGYMQEIPTGTEEPLWSIVWEPNGDYALIGGWDFILKYDGTSIQELDTEGHGFMDASWSPDGTYVLLADNDGGEIGRYDGESFSILTIPDYDDYLVQSVSFSPVTEFALIEAQNSMVGGPSQALIGYDGTGFEIIGHIGQFPEKIFWEQYGTFAYVGGSSTRDTMTIYQDGTISTLDMGEYKTALGWSPDGKYLVYKGAETIEFCR
ncbi:hypothetical protein ACFLVR_03175 [Chloroflexota bacterium]